VTKLRARFLATKKGCSEFTEQSENIYENKGRMVAQPADFTVCGSSGIRQGPASDRKDGVPRYSKKFTNEPGMSMKTNEEVKTSVMLSEAKDLQSYVFKEILQMLRSAQHDRCFARGLLDFRPFDCMILYSLFASASVQSPWEFWA